VRDLFDGVHGWLGTPRAPARLLPINRMTVSEDLAAAGSPELQGSSTEPRGNAYPVEPCSATPI
jgi:hypothetical protein